MVKAVEQKFIAELAAQLEERMAAKGIKAENLRFTLAWLPVSLDPKNPDKLAADPKAISKQLVERAQWHRVEQNVRGKKLQYCLGFNPATGEFALPHITAAQVKTPESQTAQTSLELFMDFINSVVESLDSMLTTSINAKGVFDVGPGNKSYTPVENYKTGWYDDNIDKNPLAANLKAIGQVLLAKKLLDFVVNALGAEGEKSRPHFTNWREKIEAFLSTPEVESILAEAGEKFGLVPSFAISDESGELLLNNLLAVCVDGEWVKPEQAKHIVLRPEEVPMPAYYRVAGNYVLNAYGRYVAAAAFGSVATVLTQVAVEYASGSAAPTNRLEL